MKNILSFFRHLTDDDIAGASAQTTFYLMFALFPLLLFVITLLGLMDLSVGKNDLSLVLPDSVLSLIEQLPDTSGKAQLVWPLIVALWSASSAIWALMRGVYKAVNGSRLKSSIKARGLALLLTLGFVFTIAIPIALSILAREAGGIAILRHLGAAGIIFLFITALYTFTPGCLTVKRWHGAAFSTALWLPLNYLYEQFAGLFLKINPLYSSVSAFLSAAVWIYAISFIILLGAEVNVWVGKKHLF
jgi:membrane protein